MTAVGWFVRWVYDVEESHKEETYDQQFALDFLSPYVSEWNEEDRESAIYILYKMMDPKSRIPGGGNTGVLLNKWIAAFRAI